MKNNHESRADHRPEGLSGITAEDLLKDEYKKLHGLALQMANTPDKFFLEGLSTAILSSLGFDYFIIGRLNVYTRLMRTVVMNQKGKIVENIAYSLENTPCSNVMDGSACVYPENVADAFPKDQLLVDMNISGYAGTALEIEGRPIGIMVGLTERPMKYPQQSKAVMDFFKERVAYQLEARETLDQYLQAFSDSKEGFWDWDLETGHMLVSQSVAAVLDVTSEETPEDISQIEARIHPDDKLAFRVWIQQHTRGEDSQELHVKMRCGQEAVYNPVKMRIRQCSDLNGKVNRLIGSMARLGD